MVDTLMSLLSLLKSLVPRIRYELPQPQTTFFNYQAQVLGTPRCAFSFEIFDWPEYDGQFIEQDQLPNELNYMATTSSYLLVVSSDPMDL